MPMHLHLQICFGLCVHTFVVVSLQLSVFAALYFALHVSLFILFHPEILLDERSRLKGSLFFVLHVSISFHLEIRLRSGRHFGEPCALLYTFPFKQILFVQQCPNAWGRFFERSFFLVLHVSHFFSFREPPPLGSSFWAALSFVLHISLFPISFP